MDVEIAKQSTEKIAYKTFLVDEKTRKAGQNFSNAFPQPIKTQRVIKMCVFLPTKEILKSDPIS